MASNGIGRFDITNGRTSSGIMYAVSRGIHDDVICVRCSDCPNFDIIHDRGSRTYLAKFSDGFSVDISGLDGWDMVLPFVVGKYEAYRAKKAMPYKMRPGQVLRVDELNYGIHENYQDGATQRASTSKSQQKDKQRSKKILLTQRRPV